MSRVGIVGVGAMGMAIAHNLAAKGHQVHARDVSPEAQAQARAAGMRICATPRELAQCSEFVVVVVVNAQQIEEVLFRDDGVVRATGGARTVLLASTIAPSDSVRLCDGLVRYGISSIDGPISGGPAKARDGTMSIMLAARPPVLDLWSEVLRDMAQHRFVVSHDIGDAAKAKLVNNLLAGTNLVAAAEAMALSEKLGLDSRVMYDIIGSSSGASWVFNDRMPRALAEAYAPAHAAAHILTKDLGLATALAASVGHETPLGDAALSRFRLAAENGWGDLDDAAVIKTYRP